MIPLTITMLTLAIIIGKRLKVVSQQYPASHEDQRETEWPSEGAWEGAFINHLEERH